MKALDFLHAIGKPGADAISLAKEMQDNIDALIKVAQDCTEDVCKLQGRVRILEEALEIANNQVINLKSIRTELETKFEEAKKAYKADCERMSVQIKKLDTEYCALLKNYMNLRDQANLTDALEEPYTSHSVKKLQNIPHKVLVKKCTKQAQELRHLHGKWNEAKEQLLLQERELKEMKEAVVKKLDKPREDFFPPYNPEPKTEKPTVEDLKEVYKQFRGQKETTSSFNVETGIFDGMQLSKAATQILLLTEELNRARQNILGLKGEMGRLEELLHRERADNLKWRGRFDALEQQLKKANNEVTEYRREIERLREHNTMVTACHNNQTNTIKRQMRVIEETKKLLNSIAEVVSDPNA